MVTKLAAVASSFETTVSFWRQSSLTKHHPLTNQCCGDPSAALYLCAISCLRWQNLFFLFSILLHIFLCFALLLALSSARSGMRSKLNSIPFEFGCWKKKKSRENKNSEQKNGFLPTDKKPFFCSLLQTDPKANSIVTPRGPVCVYLPSSFQPEGISWSGTPGSSFFGSCRWCSRFSRHTGSCAGL